MFSINRLDESNTLEQLQVLKNRDVSGIRIGFYDIMLNGR